MATRGVDFSFDKPNGKSLYSLGYRFVIGYVSPSGGKNISKSQVTEYHRQKLNVGIVYEGTGTEPMKGSGAALSVVRLGNRQMDSLGAPNSTTMYIAVDRQTSGASVASFFREAVKLSKRPIGVYGSYAVVKYLMDNKIVKFGWQTYAWSAGHLYGAAQVYQYSNNKHVAGGTVDLNLLEHSEAGFWLYSPAPTPPPASPYPLLVYKGPLISSNNPRFSAYAKSVQVKLTKNGFPASADGLFGPLSALAVKKYQLSRKLLADGVVGPITDSKLRKEPK